MHFTKMHGLGNDYVLVDCFKESVADAPALARTVCDRRRGVGADGLLIAGPADDGDLRMEMYDIDGTTAEMCGNGLRCVAKYAHDHGIVRQPLMRIATVAGPRLAECLLDGDVVGRVRAVMGAADYVPFGAPVFSGRGEVIDEPFEVNGRTLLGTFVSMGNPHLVVFVQDFDEIDLAGDGPALENHAAFPERINVHFARVVSPHDVAILTWERGSGAVHACGTGACASAAAAARNAQASFPITVHSPGGELLIDSVRSLDQPAWAKTHGVDLADSRYDLGGEHGLLMTGPAVEVFTGAWVT
ncbi:MAG: diaminopimelate epimerase [bacterium]|nr:diaminopimelate epimerase [bacterium]